MNMYPFTAVTNIRSHLAYKFHSLRASAQRELFLGKLTGRDTLLQTFPHGMERKNPNRKLLPIQDIPIEKIVGSVNRHDDFDYKFRPLKENARDRWIDIHLFLEEGWPPILVHKIGSEYFVEDGHHRLSVAQELGMQFILAKVWEYPVVEVLKVDPCRTSKCAATNSPKLYIPG